MSIRGSYRKKELILFVSVLLIAVAGSAYAAFLSYTGQISPEDLKFWDNEVEYDEQYQMYLLQEKHMQELARTEAEIENSAGIPASAGQPESPNEADKTRAYLRLFESETFAEFRPVIYTYTGTTDISCTSRPADGYTVCSLSSGYQGIAVGFDGDSIVLRMSDTQYAYAPKDCFTEGACFAVLDNTYDLRGFLPHAEFSMDFSTSVNFTGRSLYPAIPLLETHAAEKLLAAAEQFWRDGYEIVIRDAYRPVTAQHELWKQIEDSTYIVNPDTDTSWHNVGRAVDISLLDRTSGEEVELPSPVYDFSPASFRSNCESWTTEAQNNVRYITETMENAGFSSVDSMWWHYEYRAQGIPYMPKKLNYLDIVYVPLS